MMMAHLICISAALSFVNPAVVSSLPAKPVQPEILAIEQNIVLYTNTERQRYGLPPLSIDHSLLRSARSHASWMASSQTLTHTSAQVAENIAMGQQSSVQAVRDWMNSSGHRANILHRGHTRVGAAAYVSASGNIYWCLQLQ